MRPRRCAKQLWSSAGTSRPGQSLRADTLRHTHTDWAQQRGPRRCHSPAARPAGPHLGGGRRARQAARQPRRWCAASARRSSPRWAAAGLSTVAGRAAGPVTRPGAQVICPEPWKAGSTNNNPSSAGQGGRQVNENKLITKKKRRALGRPGGWLVARPVVLTAACRPQVAALLGQVQGVQEQPAPGGHLLPNVRVQQGPVRHVRQADPGHLQPQDEPRVSWAWASVYQSSHLEGRERAQRMILRHAVSHICQACMDPAGGHWLQGTAWRGPEGSALQSRGIAGLICWPAS